MILVATVCYGDLLRLAAAVVPFFLLPQNSLQHG
jgi:hypothetical protein